MEFTFINCANNESDTISKSRIVKDGVISYKNGCFEFKDFEFETVRAETYHLTLNQTIHKAILGTLIGPLTSSLIASSHNENLEVSKQQPLMH